ncbi:MAG: sugar kinase, partial [Pedobacter sp.]
LFDVEQSKWSDELCAYYQLDQALLPPLRQSGSLLGSVLPEVSFQIGLSGSIDVIVGGADTQLAIKSTMPDLGDIVVVSGTTTPLTLVTGNYLLDTKKRTWTGRHLDDGEFILEANAGVTGLNIQRLKGIFYPNESYQVMERELELTVSDSCVSSLGSMIADEDAQLQKGGFIFDVPVAQQLSRADFIKAAIWDSCCAIKENFDTLCRVAPYDQDYVWACGGGLQGRYFAQCLANLLNKNIRLRAGYVHASVIGATILCNQSAGISNANKLEFDTIVPHFDTETTQNYNKWAENRKALKLSFSN